MQCSCRSQDYINALILTTLGWSLTAAVMYSNIGTGFFSLHSQGSDVSEADPQALLESMKVSDCLMLHT